MEMKVGSSLESTQEQRPAVLDHAPADAVNVGRHLLQNSSQLPFLEPDFESLEKCFDLQTGVIFYRDSRTGFKTFTDPRHQLQEQQEGGHANSQTFIDPHCQLEQQQEGGHANSETSIDSHCQLQQQQEGGHANSETSTDPHRQLQQQQVGAHVNFETSTDPCSQLQQQQEGVHANSEPMLGLARSLAEPTQEPTPTSESLNQSKTTDTLEKIHVPLQQLQCNCKAASCLSVPTQTLTQTSSSSTFSTWCMSTNLPFALPTRTPPQPLSPHTSDVSCVASSKWSQHSLTFPPVMRFNGEDLDDLDADVSSSDSSPSSQALHDSTTQETRREALSILVAMGCTTCLMFVMVSKDNPTCPKCGSTILLEIPPTS